MKPLAFTAAALAVILAIAAGLLVFGQPSEDSGQPLSPTVNVGKIKERPGDGPVQDTAQSKPAGPDSTLPGAKKAKVTGPARLTASQEAEYRKAMELSAAGLKPALASSQLKKFGAKLLRSKNLSGRKVSIWRLPSGKQYLMVVTTRDAVLTSAPATLYAK